MASLGAYTTTEAVRGCLGIDADDCPDSYMLDSQLALELKVELDGWLPAHATLYSTGTTGTPSAAQTAISDRISLYCQWFCAMEIANRPLTVPQITTDGKAQIDRFKVDLARLASLAASKAAKYRAELLNLVNATPAPAPYTNFVGVAVPGADPVTEVIQ